MTKKLFIILAGLVVFLLAGCASADTANQSEEPFVIGAIPDQDPEKLQRRFGLLAEYLEQELGVPVEYKPVTDYAASVTAFKVGDLDMVWFGGLTGVQARLQVDGAEALVQRDLDEAFTSVFIAAADSDLQAFSDVSDLSQLAGRSFTFGSESSTSGRLMPQYFLSEAGVTLADLNGEPGFSGSHDATIELVAAGTYETGALNSQVWKDRLEAGEVDLSRVKLLFETPTYHDYHWVARPDLKERYGDDFPQKVQTAFLNLDINNPEHKEILDLFSAEKFIATNNANYAQIEAVGREVGKISE